MKSDEQLFKTCIVTFTYPTSHMSARNGYYFIMHNMETIAKPTRSVLILENVERSGTHISMLLCEHEIKREQGCRNVQI